MADLNELTKSFDGLSRMISQLDLGGSVPQFRTSDVKIPRNPLVDVAEANYASEFHKRLVKWIGDFDAALDQAHEVGVRLVSFGQTVVFHLDRIDYWDPSLISFSGVTDDGTPVELIQHVSQISVLLMKLPRRYRLNQNGRSVLKCRRMQTLGERSRNSGLRLHGPSDWASGNAF